MPDVRVCTAFVIGIDNAIVQEIAILYMQCSYPLRTAVAGGLHLLKNEYIRVCQRLYMVKQCTVMSVHENMKMLQES